MNKLLISLWLIGSMIVAVAVAPYLAGADSELQQRREKNAEAIASMTQSARQRLERNYEDFQRLSVEEKEEMAALHQQITDDAKVNHGELQTVMNQYDNWLKTIDGKRRDQLYNTTDPEQRIELMQSIVNRKQDWRAGGFSGMAGEIKLSPTELETVMTAMEKAAVDRLDDSEQEAYEQKSGLNRYYSFLRVLQETDRDRRALLVEPPRELDVVAELLSTLPINSSVVSFVNSAPERDRGKTLGFVVLKSIQLELEARREEVWSSDRPKPEQLKEYFGKLPVDEQNDLLADEVTEFQFELRSRYAEELKLANLPDRSEFNVVFLGDSWGRRGRGGRRGGPRGDFPQGGIGGPRGSFPGGGQGNRGGRGGDGDRRNGPPFGPESSQRRDRDDNREDSTPSEHSTTAEPDDTDEK